MEKLKEALGKVSKWIWLVVAGVVIAFVAWKKHVLDEMEKHNKQGEQEIKDNAASVLVKETEKVDAQTKTQVAEVQKEKEVKKTQAAEEAKKTADVLKKGSSADLKKEAEATLGVKEKKKGGRPKKK